MMGKAVKELIRFLNVQYLISNKTCFMWSSRRSCSILILKWPALQEFFEYSNYSYTESCTFSCKAIKVSFHRDLVISCIWFRETMSPLDLSKFAKEGHVGGGHGGRLPSHPWKSPNVLQYFVVTYSIIALNSLETLRVWNFRFRRIFFKSRRNNKLRPIHWPMITFENINTQWCGVGWKNCCCWAKSL